jgi:MFS transporter, DHA1 family, inner membrane transport protein
MPRASAHPVWIALLYLAGTLAACQYAKIPHILPGLLMQTPMSGMQQAIALSLIGVAGVIAGSFAGAAVMALGLRRSLVAGLLLGLVGALLPLAVASYKLILLARLIESISHMAIVVTVPTLMLALCRPDHRPRLMALWSAYFTVTFIVVALLAPKILSLAGWQGMAGLHALMLLLLGLAMLRLPSQESTSDTSVELRAGPLSLAALWHAQVRLLGQRRLLVIPATFFGYTLLFVALVSALPRELGQAGISQAHALAQPAWVWAMALPGAALVGTGLSMLALRQGMPAFQLVSISAAGLVLAACGLAFLTQGGLFMSLTALAAFVLLGLLPAGVVGSIPSLFPPDEPDIALVNGGLVQFGNLGNFVGSPILAALLMHFGWFGFSAYLFAGALIVTVGLFFLRRVVLEQPTNQATH